MSGPDTDPTHVTVRELYQMLTDTQDRMVKVIEVTEQRIADKLAEHLRDHQQHQADQVSRTRFLLVQAVAWVGALGMAVQLVLTLAGV